MSSLDEAFAKEAFTRLLQRLGVAEPPVWEAGAEPPDFFLTLGNARYGVEVTRVVAQVELGGKVQSKHRVGAPLDRFAKELQETARQRGILHGAYVISIEPIPDFKEVAPKARDAFLDYVLRTRDMTTAPEEFVLERPDSHWSIQKYHDEKTYLLAVRDEGSGGLMSEILQDFPGLLETAIEGKAHKLAAVDLPWILLLVDDYHYAGRDLWRASVHTPSRPKFHTIARTFQDYECEILCSKDTSWSGGVEC